MISVGKMIPRARFEDFVCESNRIEGIEREPTDAEVVAHVQFLTRPHITVVALKRLVNVLQPNARFRDVAGLDVRVGQHVPPPGGPYIRAHLSEILDAANAHENTPYEIHQQYEALHPFTDGNGRSGRALWLWMMRGDAPLGFLHTWYYQSLQGAR